MKEPLHDYMRPGLVHFMAYPEVMGGDGPVIETLTETLADQFFSVLEITGIKDSAVRAEAAALLAAGGVEVAYGAQPTIIGRKLEPCSSDESTRRRAEEVLLAELDQAAELGAGRMAILSGPDPGPARREPALEALRQTVSVLCRRAAKLDMMLVLETFDRDVDKRSLLGPSREAAEFARAVRRDWDNFGLMLDLSHLPLLKEDPSEAVGALADSLAHVHVGNCVLDPSDPAHGDSHPRFGYPGGENDIPELTAFLTALLAHGYLAPGKRSIVSFEVKPMKNESSRVVVAGSKRALMAAWAEV